MSERIDTAALRAGLTGGWLTANGMVPSLLDEIDRLTAALVEAEDRGAAQMRERAAVEIVNQDCSAGDLAESIRALPLRDPGGA